MHTYLALQEALSRLPQQRALCSHQSALCALLRKVKSQDALPCGPELTPAKSKVTFKILTFPHVHSPDEVRNSSP